MRHLRQCRSEDIFTGNDISEGKCSNGAQDDSSRSFGDSRPNLFNESTHHIDDDSDYSDPFIDSSDDDEEEEEIEFPHIEVNPNFEVQSRGDPHDASLYVDVIAQILHNEEPEYVVEPGSIEKTQGNKIREHRMMLGDWLFNLSFFYPSTTEALFQCISLFDRYLSNVNVPFEQLQLICSCCMWISAKVELHSEDSLEPLRKCIHEKFSRQDFIKAEADILMGVNYKIHTVTPHFFLKRFLKAIDANEKIEFLASFLCGSTLLFCEVSCYRPSVVAFCSIAAACLAFGEGEKIRSLGNFGQNFKWEDVARCFTLILHAGKVVAAREKSFIFRKFGKNKIDGVSNGGANLLKSISLGSDLLRSLAKLFC
ncbi:Cyclin, N-terminal domain containing protein [Tritrichomonas foetus]|uniref:Cyclin, N-terminal domain containing protein n=1 Tax=Tritrichomonas foetus TaxID=1144522 RepID=A0A1J4K9T9_9EUKA|nr:Cyclin, N-terminal domain containing protein [Tritrichomonas foetus]|eukprot:OHT06406.1 Cyclin, N-terminal domain containing protein [Tritrichomonas foetus]